MKTIPAPCGGLRGKRTRRELAATGARPLGRHRERADRAGGAQRDRPATRRITGSRPVRPTGSARFLAEGVGRSCRRPEVRSGRHPSGELRIACVRFRQTSRRQVEGREWRTVVDAADPASRPRGSEQPRRLLDLVSFRRDRAQRLEAVRDALRVGQARRAPLRLRPTRRTAGRRRARPPGGVRSG